MTKKSLTIITGAGRGLGFGLVQKLNESKKNILCITKSQAKIKKLKKIKSQTKNNNFFYIIKCDVRDNLKLKNLLKKINFKIYDEFNFILCAAIVEPPGNLSTFNYKKWLETYEINVLGNLNILSLFYAKIKNSKKAKTLFFSGGGSAYAYPNFFSYSLSKTAIVRAAENLQEEFKFHKNFISLAIAPGAMNTEMTKKVEKYDGKIKTYVPIDETINKVFDMLFKLDISHLKGKFIHVRDKISSKINIQNKWLLRRLD